MALRRLMKVMSTLPDTPLTRPDEAGETTPLLSSQAYQRLRHMIVTLQLEPGELINEAALIEDLQLGRTPIREALQRLANEGLVEQRARRGLFVANFSITDLHQLFELRRTLEGYAAALAAQRATRADVEALEATLRPLDSLGADAGVGAYIDLDAAFHQGVARAAHNKFLVATLWRLYTLSLRVWYLALNSIGPMRPAIEEHRRVLTAITRRDSAEASAAMQQHITHFHERIREIL